MTPKQIIEEAIKILKNKKYSLRSFPNDELNFIDVDAHLTSKYLFNLRLDSSNLILQRFKKSSAGMEVVESHSIKLTPSFASNMDEFVFLLRLKYPEVYEMWAKSSK